MTKVLNYYHIMHLYRYTTESVHYTKTACGRPCMALYGPPTYCGAAIFGPPSIFKWEGLIFIEFAQGIDW